MEVYTGLCQECACVKGYCEYRIKVFLFCNRVNFLQTRKIENEIQGCNNALSFSKLSKLRFVC